MRAVADGRAMTTEAHESIFGQCGVLASDGSRVQCHLCGAWFAHLGNHVNRRHHVSCDAYRIQFGLQQKTGLIGPKLKQLRQQNVQHLAGYKDQISAYLKGVSFDQRSQWMKSKRLRLEAFVDAKSVATRKLNAAKANLSRNRIHGGHVFTKEDQEKSIATWRQMRQNPMTKQAWAIKIANARGALQMRICVVCGKEFKKQRRQTCSNECLAAMRRVAIVHHVQRSDVRIRMSQSAQKRMIRRIRNEVGQFVGTEGHAVQQTDGATHKSGAGERVVMAVTT
jgi:predicted transcriptional regulator